MKNKSPPGRKVYERGAHTIWEIDGAVAKVRFLIPSFVRKPESTDETLSRG